MIAAIDIDWGKLLEAAVVSAVFGIGVVVVAGIAVVASLRAQDRTAAQRGGAVAYQLLTGACVLGIAAAIVLAIYTMAQK
jgi:hypothetical protein